MGASEGAMAQIAPEGETRTLVVVRDVQLECIIHRSAYASSSSKPSVAVVVLHPYSWLGGCMYDHVVQRLYSAFAGTRQYNTVLAYNSRGVGRSSGRASVFGAKREVEDLMALCRFLQSNLTHPPDRILLVGYSHGSCVACGASRAVRLGHLLRVAPTGKSGQHSSRPQGSLEGVLSIDKAALGLPGDDGHLLLGEPAREEARDGGRVRDRNESGEEDLSRGGSLLDKAVG